MIISARIRRGGQKGGGRRGGERGGVKELNRPRIHVRTRKVVSGGSSQR